MAALQCLRLHTTSGSLRLLVWMMAIRTRATERGTWVSFTAEGSNSQLRCGWQARYILGWRAGVLVAYAGTYAGTFRVA